MDNKYFISDYMPGVQVRCVNKFIMLRSDVSIASIPAGTLRKSLLIHKAQRRILVLNLMALFVIRFIATIIATILWVMPLAVLAHYGIRFSPLGIPVGLAIALSWIVIWECNFWIQTDSDRIKIKGRG